jgi:hypothetical protein
LEKEFDKKTFSSTNKPKVFNSFKDAKEYAEKMEKMFRNSIGGSTAYWVSDEKMNRVEESVNEDKVYIDFLNKKKGFKQDRIKFNSYEDAVKWARKNFEKFNSDMIKYESINEAIQNAPAKNGKELADFILRHYDFYTDYIDDGGQRRRAIKSNEGTIEWFDSHPIDLKKEALKILQSKVGSSGKSQIQRVFGKSTMDK